MILISLYSFPRSQSVSEILIDNISCSFRMCDTHFGHFVDLIEPAAVTAEKRAWGRRAVGHACRLDVKKLYADSRELFDLWDRLIHIVEDASLSYSLVFGRLLVSSPAEVCSGVIEGGFRSLVELLGLRRHAATQVRPHNGFLVSGLFGSKASDFIFFSCCGVTRRSPVCRLLTPLLLSFARS